MFLLQPRCPAITAHPTPNTHKSAYPQIIMCVLLRMLSLGLCEAQTISNHFTRMLHTLSFILSDEIMPPETVSHTMVFRRKIIVGFWRKFWAKFQTEAEKSRKVNFILDKQENWKISTTVSMGDFRISQRG